MIIGLGLQLLESKDPLGKGVTQCIMIMLTHWLQFDKTPDAIRLRSDCGYHCVPAALHMPFKSCQGS